VSDRALAHEARVVAQAKINLFLRILAREASGYHAIETLFQRLDLGDDVTVRVTPGTRGIDCRGADTGPAERNLAYRAAAAYAAATGWPAGFAIEIDKRIPVGGGLGGGSADAGAVLRCLNALAPRPVSASALLALAAPLGADVPFLTLEAPLALAWSRGERMLALPPLPRRPVVLALSDTGVGTADAYAALAAARGAFVPEPVSWTADRFASWRAVAEIAVNDFEPVVFAGRPDLAQARDELRRLGRALHDLADESFALMSGSGATVFLVAPAEDPAVTFGGPTAPGIVFTSTAARVAEVQVLG
jgi:4-diphosphocytidyl-2-C-methyl-D-erythritol kinase